MRKLMIFMLSLLVLSALAQKSDFKIGEFYPIDSEHSYLMFSVTYMGYAKVKGDFIDFSGTIRYDPENISKTSVFLQVETNSIDTDLNWRDNDLKSPRWFDVETFPTITFISKKANPSNNGFIITGDLTIKDITKEISIEMNPASGILKDMWGDHQVIFSGSYTLDRTDYNVQGKGWSEIKEGFAGVASEVLVEISLLAKQYKEGNSSSFTRPNRADRPPGRVWAAYKQGGIKEALMEFEKIKSETNINQDPLNSVGYLLLLQGKTKDAIAIFDKNSKVFSDSRSYTLLADAYTHIGDLKKAKESYQKALEIDSNNTYAKEILRHLN